MYRQLLARKSVMALRGLAVAILIAVILSPPVVAENPRAADTKDRAIFADSLESASRATKTVRQADRTSNQGRVGQHRPNYLPTAVSATKTVAIVQQPRPASGTTSKLDLMSPSAVPPPAPPREPDLRPLPSNAQQEAVSPGETSAVDAAAIHQGSLSSPRRMIHAVTESNDVPAVPTPASASGEQNTAAIPSMSDLGLCRPLASVTLSSALSQTSLAGDELKVPDDQAATLFAAYGVHHELPIVRGSMAPRRNLYAVCYNPLYFEDPNMERCGIGYGCMTDMVSAVRFFGRVPLVPYLWGTAAPNRCVPALGDCPLCHQFGCDAYVPPLNSDGASWQALITVGLVFLIP